MTKYFFIASFFMISMVAIANEKSMLGERNASTTSDPCQAQNIVGCGPCFKACMSQHHGDLKKDVANSPSKSQKRSGKQSTTAQ
jgi:hypothetical protein